MPVRNSFSELRSIASCSEAEFEYGDASQFQDYDSRFSSDLDSPVSTFAYLCFKRTLDLSIVILIFPFVLILGLVIALLIAVDSPGPVFFSHRRVHRGGAFFSMWKFRTMCQNSAEMLRQHLENHPEDREEWAISHKLKNDPRVSALGFFLRRTSLDELPQILNVFAGSMSLVGPRPIVAAEIEKYGEDFVFYTAVKPGITGLWQASGRSTLTYAQRVALDRYYVEHWSIWLEIKILLRTIRSVIRGNGAY